MVTLSPQNPKSVRPKLGAQVTLGFLRLRLRIQQDYMGMILLVLVPIQASLSLPKS